MLGNDGTGGFVTTGVYRIHDGPWDLAANDMDGDGDLDIVAVASDSNRIVVLANDGTGAFPTRNPEPTATFPLGAFTADLDGDGDVDALSSNFRGGSVGVYVNDGLGTLTLDTLLVVNRSGSYTWAHDLDGDGDLDLSVVDELADSPFVFYNDAGPTGVAEGSDAEGVGALGADAAVGGGLRAGPALLVRPNPARADAVVSLSLAGLEGRVAIDVVSADGRRVRRLWDGALAGGRGDLLRDGRDGRGRPLPPGRYIVTAEGASGRAARAITLAR